MSCLNPKKGFPYGKTKNGKVALKIMPYDVMAIDEKGSPIFGTGYDKNLCQDKFFEIPCGKCLGCRRDQAKEWSDRLIMEMQKYNDDSCYFITLTYDDIHLPLRSYIDDLTGELKYHGTLQKEDYQKFMKRLRKARPDDKLRYYLAAEYGPVTERPHAHMIIYGLHLLDWKLEESGHSETGQIYYTCEELQKIWNKGFISIEPANEYTCKYVCSYVTSKIGDAASQKYWKEKGLETPFALSSRRPGIGRDYYEKMKNELFDFEEHYIGTMEGSVKVKVPRYFKKLYRESHQEKYDVIRDRHLKCSEISDDAKTTITDLNKKELLNINKYNLENKTKQRNSL